MAQAVFIATEISSPTSNNKPSIMATDSQAEAFATEMNRLLSDNVDTPLALPVAVDKAASLAKVTEIDVTTDGNNLPELNVNAETPIVAVDTVEDDLPIPAVKPGELDEDKAPIQRRDERDENDTFRTMATANVDLTPSVTTAQQQKSAEITQTKAVQTIEKPTQVSQQQTEASDKAVMPSKQDTGAVEAEVVGSESKTAKPAVPMRADILDALTKHQQKSSNNVSTPNANSSSQSVSSAVPQNVRTILNEQIGQQIQTENVITKTISPQPEAMVAERAVLPAMTAAATSLSALQSATTTTAPVQSATLPTLTVQPNLQQAAWGQVMSSRVLWMAKEGIQQAEIRLNPANMGPVEVRLHIQNEQASVTFLAQQVATREALEQALPRLRESFAEAGLQLTNAEVGEQGRQQQQQAERDSASHIFSQAGGISVDTGIEVEPQVNSDDTTSGLSLYA